jgi:predicted Zn-dependent peptidase
LSALHRIARFVFFLLLSQALSLLAGEPRVETATLKNGIQVAMVEISGSTNLSLFTFLPMDLVGDDAGKAQWAHLVEHLVIRTTIPDDLTEANAETGPDNMRLDFYGNTKNWKEGLSHQRRWLEGLPFTEANLAAEKPKVVSECDYTAKNSFTHKFAMAAWAQGRRHGQDKIQMKRDVLHANLADVQKYRDERLFVPSQTTVCFVGGLSAKVFLAEAEKELGGLKSQAKPPPKTKLREGNLDLTWDLDARHLILSWPMPDSTDGGFPALTIAAQCLTMQFFSDAELKQQTGMVLAGTDLVTPEGRFFYISASLKPSADLAAIEKKLRAAAASLASEQFPFVPQIPMIGQQWGYSLVHVPDPDLALAQAPPNMDRAMMEGNLGLGFCLNVHRYGAKRETLAKQFSNVSATQVREAAKKFLASDKGMLTMIHH